MAQVRRKSKQTKPCAACVDSTGCRSGATGRGRRAGAGRKAENCLRHSRCFSPWRAWRHLWRAGRRFPQPTRGGLGADKRQFRNRRRGRCQSQARSQQARDVRHDDARRFLGRVSRKGKPGAQKAEKSAGARAAVRFLLANAQQEHQQAENIGILQRRKRSPVCSAICLRKFWRDSAMLSIEGAGYGQIGRLFVVDSRSESAIGFGEAFKRRIGGIVVEFFVLDLKAENRFGDGADHGPMLVDEVREKTTYRGTENPRLEAASGARLHSDARRSGAGSRGDSRWLLRALCRSRWRRFFRPWRDKTAWAGASRKWDRPFHSFSFFRRLNRALRNNS